ncbi:MAG: radical SAM protein [Candidatus Omnitrophica bacterium]|nr:radical SAM protein [Candidatus Omnitrophota bacterium]
MSYLSDIKKVIRTNEAIEFPKVILIDNFNGCNLRCSICDHKNMEKYRRIQKMDLELYEKVIDEIAVMDPDARVWEIFFGDPFLCKDMPMRIKYAKDKGLKDVVLNTNGALMTPERAKPVIEAGLDAMYVGIDATKAGTYDKIRVGGDFNKTVENTLSYRDLLKKYGTENQKLYVQFVVCGINSDEAEGFKDFWTKEKINVKIRPKVSWAGLVEAMNLRDNKGLTRKPCYWLMRTINICADGEVTLCSVDVHCHVKCGNAADKTIKEIWDGKLKEYRAMHNAGRYDALPPMCRDCGDWQSTYAEFFKPAL